MGNTRSVAVGAVIAVVMFATVPLAQVAGRHARTGATGDVAHAIADRVGSLVTNLVETHTRMSVALSEVGR